MAIGTLSNFQVYENQFFGGMFEVLERNVNAFNQFSAGCISLTTDFQKGKFEEESFFQKPTSLINHRDPTSTSAATASYLSQEKVRGVKINKRIGPVENTFDSFKKIGVPIEQMAFVLGQQAAPDIQACYLNSAVSGLTGTFSATGMSGLIYSALGESSKTMSHTYLVKGLAKFGDAAQRIRLWVMHSKVFYDLVGQAITDKLLEVTAGVIYGGGPGTLGRPVLVTDTPALYDASTLSSTSDDFYWTFGLTEGSVSIKESEERSMLIEPVGGLNNLVVRYQGEFAYNALVKGMEWNTATPNPTDAQLATSSNWTKRFADLKSMSGIAIKTK